jgi:non-ribosomal peptide synthetase component F
MLLFSAYNVLLSRYTGQEDIVVGTPVEGRRHDDLRPLIGMFVGTLAVRSRPAGDKPFDVFLEEVKHNLLEAYENQDYPFERLLEKTAVRREASRNPLFDTMFVLQNTDLSALSEAGFNAEFFEYDNNTAKFDMTVEALEQGGTIGLIIEYCTDLFKEDTIRRIEGHFENILADIAANPSKRLRDIELLSERERRQLLVEFNDTAADYPRDKTIHQIFEEQAEKNPDKTALVLTGETMTYRQLNERANRLARRLRDSGVGPDDVVGLIVDRSFEMIVSIFAVLKAGGAYMPIDPDYPAERIGYMLDNSGAKILLTKRALIKGAHYDVPVIELEDPSCWLSDSSNPDSVSKPTDLAYIIYTSGSTGRPKGVMIDHRTLVGLLFNDRFGFDFSELDVWTLYHSYCFDFTVWEMYGSLLRGGKLVIVSPEVVLDQKLYLELLEKECVTILNQTPQSMYNLIDLELQSERKQLCFRYVFLGGEAFKTLKL